MIERNPRVDYVARAKTINLAQPRRHAPLGHENDGLIRRRHHWHRSGRGHARAYSLHGNIAVRRTPSGRGQYSVRLEVSTILEGFAQQSAGARSAASRCTSALSPAAIAGTAHR